MLLEVLWLRSGKAVYMRLYRFWAKLFGLAFSMGVVTGVVVLSFELGTHSPRSPAPPATCWVRCSPALVAFRTLTH